MTKKAKPKSWKVWVSMGTKNPAPFRRFFLNANARLLTVWQGKSHPDGTAMRATLTLTPKRAKRRKK